MRPNPNESGRLLHPFRCCSRVTFTPRHPRHPRSPPPQSDGQADAAEAQRLILKGLMKGRRRRCRRRQESSCMLGGGGGGGGGGDSGGRNLLQRVQTETSGSMAAGPEGAAVGRRSSRRIDPGLRR